MRLSLARSLLIFFLLVFAPPRVWAASAGTLDRLTQQLDDRLRRALGGGSLRADDLALSLSSSRGISADLLRRVQQLLVGRLHRDFRSVGQIKASSAERRRRAARTAGYELLLDLALRVNQGHLLLQGDLVDTRRSFWRDLAQPWRGTRNYLHAGVRVDAEVRAFLGPLRGGAVRFSPRKIALGREAPLAVAAGDVEGDGQTELVVLYPRRLRVLRHDPATGDFKEISTVALEGPSPAVRPRRAVGVLRVVDLDGDGRAEILARSSEMTQGRLITSKLKGRPNVQLLEGYPVGARTGPRGMELILGELAEGQDLLLSGRLVFKPAGTAHAWQKQLPPTFYSLKARTLSSAKGPSSYLGLVSGAGQLYLSSSGEAFRRVAWPRVGVGFDLLDLDDDGVLEAVVTGGGDQHEEDQVEVLSLKDGVKPRLLWRSSPVEGQVMDVTHGDFDGDGLMEVVCAVRVGSGDHLLMVLN